MAEISGLMLNRRCAMCRKINIDLDYDFFHHNHRTLKVSAARGCPICDFLYTTIVMNLISIMKKINPESRLRVTRRGPRFEIVDYSSRTREFEFYRVRDERLPLDDELCFRKVQNNPTSEACFRVALDWITTCVDTHEICKQNPQDMVLPSRLIDVSKLRPCLVSTPEGSCQYISLSYCWGPQQSETNVPSLETSFLSPHSKKGSDTNLPNVESKYAILDSIDPNWNDTWGKDLREMGIANDLIREDQEFIVSLIREREVEATTTPQISELSTPSSNLKNNSAEPTFGVPPTFPVRSSGPTAPPPPPMPSSGRTSTTPPPPSIPSSGPKTPPPPFKNSFSGTTPPLPSSSFTRSPLTTPILDGSKGPILTTTLTSLQSRQKRIEMSRVPKTLQDAINITRRLKVKYLWVDSVCIIQDSKEDWTREASRMGEYYANSYLTLSALDSKDAQLGMLLPRKDISSVHIEGNLFLRSATRSWRETFSEAALSRRAWALQERLLATRILHYGKDDMFWECITCSTRESSTTQYTFNQQSIEWHDEDFKRSLFAPKAIQPTTSTADVLSKWYRILNQYSKLALTHNSDKLPALSGLASKTRDSLKGIERAHMPEPGEGRTRYGDILQDFGRMTYTTVFSGSKMGYWAPRNPAPIKPHHGRGLL